jgi:hypothetical protein
MFVVDLSAGGFATVQTVVIEGSDAFLDMTDSAIGRGAVGERYETRQQTGGDERLLHGANLLFSKGAPKR